MEENQQTATSSNMAKLRHPARKKAECGMSMAKQEKV